MNTRQPSHPGVILYDEFITPNDLQVKQVAEHIGIHRNTLNQFLHGRIKCTVSTAMRLSLAFNTTIDFWLNLQRNYDKWEVINSPAYHESIQNIKPIVERK